MRTRHDGFGDEVKRRIMLGTYALSAGYYDAFYGTAQKVRTVIKREHDALFERFDVLVSPTCATTAFPLGAKAQDPLAMYLTDVLTIPSNMAGPAGPLDALRALRRAAGRAPADRPAVLRERALPDRPRARARRSGSTPSRRGCDELGAGDRARDPRPAEDADEDVLPLRERLRRRAEHADLPGLPRLPGRAPGAEPARRSRQTIRLGLALGCEIAERAVFHRKNYFYPDLPEGLPDLPVRRAALHAAAASSCRPQDGERRGRDRARPPRGGRRQERPRRRLGPHPRRDRDARRLQPGRHAAARDRHRARAALGRAREALPAAAAPDGRRARALRRRAREGLDALRRQRLGAPGRARTSCAPAPSSRT